MKHSYKNLAEHYLLKLLPIDDWGICGTIRNATLTSAAVCEKQTKQWGNAVAKQVFNIPASKLVWAARIENNPVDVTGAKVAGWHVHYIVFRYFISRQLEELAFEDVKKRLDAKWPVRKNALTTPFVPTGATVNEWCDYITKVGEMDKNESHFVLSSKAKQIITKINKTVSEGGNADEVLKIYKS